MQKQMMVGRKRTSCIGETASDKKARRRMGAEEEEARQRAEGERIVEEDPAWMTPERAEQVRIAFEEGRSALRLGCARSDVRRYRSSISGTSRCP
jgi:hypothetical protein